MNTQLIDWANSHPILFITIVVWSAVWKLIALWKSARNGHMTVFIVLAILNTLGIAEIAYLIYLYFKSKKKATENI